jgi:hypothetical protein
LYEDNLHINYELVKECEKLNMENKQLEDARAQLEDDFQTFRNKVFQSVEDNYTAVTIMYYTNFSKTERKITLAIPYEKYDYYHSLNHPKWDANRNLSLASEYITSNESIIIEIVAAVKSQTQSKEEIANSLLDFVQDKRHGLSIRYYPTSELKYPIETLVEMGGDCDTHAILYATLMKTAGFKVLLLFSNEKINDQFHVAIAVHFENPPKHSLTEIEDSSFTYNEEKYYYAETTGWNWRVGDLPPIFQNLTFQIMPL